MELAVRAPKGNKQPVAKARAARAPRGAKKRATAILIGRKVTEEMSTAQLYAFWSARTMRVPPPLRTSFGNFTTINSVARFTITTSTTNNLYLWMPWTASPLAAVLVNSIAAGCTQYLYNTLATSPPLLTRPLRSSWSLECTTQQTNVAGSIRVYSYDNAIITSFTVGTAATGLVAAPAGDTVFAPLVNAAPDTEEISAAALLVEQEFVSVPSSYPAYNAYYDFIGFTNTVDASSMQNVDAKNLIAGAQAVPSLFPQLAATTDSTGYNGSAGMGGLPPMRGFLVEFPATPTVQTYRVATHRQDGGRYAVNTLGATFATNPPKMDAAGEDRFLGFSKAISLLPSAAMLVTSVTAAGAAANAINLGLAAASAFSGRRSAPGAAGIEMPRTYRGRNFGRG